MILLADHAVSSYSLLVLLSMARPMRTLVVSLSFLLVALASLCPDVSHAYGAVARGADEMGFRRFNAVVNRPTFDAAKADALAACEKSGRRECAIETTFTLSCVAGAGSAAVHSYKYAVNPDRMEAISRANSACQLHGLRCSYLGAICDGARVASSDLNIGYEPPPASFLLVIGIPLLGALLGFGHGWCVAIGERLRDRSVPPFLPLSSSLLGFFLAGLPMALTVGEPFFLVSGARLSGVWWDIASVVALLGFLVSVFLAPYRVVTTLPPFFIGLVFLLSRHPAERVITPALRTNRPIDGEALVRSTTAESRSLLPRLFSSWMQTRRARHLAERALATAAQTEAERDVHRAAHRLEIARGEEQAARDALERVKREAKERKRKS